MRIRAIDALSLPRPMVASRHIRLERRATARTSIPLSQKTYGRGPLRPTWSKQPTHGGRVPKRRNLPPVGEKTRVYIETGSKRTFASAADWPGWSRSARDEAGALKALAD